LLRGFRIGQHTFATYQGKVDTLKVVLILKLADKTTLADINILEELLNRKMIFQERKNRNSNLSHLFI